MSFVSSKGNILCRLVKIELYKIFAIINRAIKGLHCTLRKSKKFQAHSFQQTSKQNRVPVVDFNQNQHFENED